MPWNQNLSNLRDVLASLYPDPDDARLVVSDAGLDPLTIAFSAKPINNWFNILSEADKQEAVGDIVAIAVKRYPKKKDALLLAVQGHLTAVKGPDMGQDLTWKAKAASSAALEKITGAQSTLLPIRFLETGLLRAKSVARVRLADGSSGSGFMIANNLLITNNHVLPDTSSASGAIVQFNYQETLAGIAAAMEEFPLDPASAFATSPEAENDWTAVRLKGDTNKWGTLTLAPIQVKVNDFVNIIQHPGGGPKQIALYHNLVMYVDNKRVQYLTDTMPGSSGSPVFDSQWRVVALHHSGGWFDEPASGQKYLRNEGIHINAVIDGLKNAGLYPG